MTWISRPLFTSLLLTLVSACGRSPLPEVCADGFTLEASGICVCENSSVCPDGFGCIGGTCRCVDDGCCPDGHRFIAGVGDELDSCVCVSDACCPPGTRYDAARDECVCASDSCCPTGYLLEVSTETCHCQDDACCPEGFRYLADSDLCECSSDGCCPENTRYDEVGRGCTCADDACCPEAHVYSAAVQACVCVGEGCCPAGFEQRPDGSCACNTDAACPAGLVCDRAENRCICTSDESCPSNSFCNQYGFCQNRQGCTRNDDCPAGFFCHREAQTCLAEGSCASNLHCGIEEHCAGARCVPGCDDSADCRPGDVCINRRCESDRCDDNNYCPLASFCDVRSQSCGPRDPAHCRSCDFGCNFGPCLVRIIEGEEGFTFCGVPCVDEFDCPGQMACGSSYQTCEVGFGGCPPGLLCATVEVLNEGFLDFCVDPGTGQPAVIARYCTPLGSQCF
jgi:hypothetical protein